MLEKSSEKMKWIQSLELEGHAQIYARSEKIAIVMGSGLFVPWTLACF